jgi:hypothetical protein
MKVIIALLLCALAGATVTCEKGGLPCDLDKCHYPAYIEGCLSYSPDDRCA